MGNVRFHFGQPVHGWMEVQVFDSENSVTLDVSDVPCNSLENLVYAMLKLLECSSMETVEWSLEPAYAVWSFTRSGSTLRLDVDPDGRRRSLISFQDQNVTMIHRVYKALRDLEACPDWALRESATRVWSWDFPGKPLSQLADRLREASSAEGNRPQG